MTAGSIIVPTIIPLRPPIPGKPKHMIDTNTRIEIKSGVFVCIVLTMLSFCWLLLFTKLLNADSNNVDIYYTMDGSKPEPFAVLGTDRSTFRYRGPFTLPDGKQTVKAMATSRSVCT